MTVAATLPLSLVVLAALVPLGLASVFSDEVRSSTRRLALDYGVFVLFGFFAVVGVWLFLNRDAAFFEVLLERYWLAALFAIFILEGAMLLYFAPSESLVPVAIGLAVETDIAPNTLPVYALIIGTSVVGATIGQYLLFLLAKRWGRERLLERPWFRISDSQLDRFEGWFGKWGLFAVPVSNSLLFTRGMLTVPAGLSEMKDSHFVALSALGTLSFEVILALLTLGVIELGFL
ncbi:DedA family protein [Haloarchaeobius sp. DT45]|uniref:DedA family protein n=1 Tax=Haloarchaeobius sp. DT45 TaxID=3446116 RepID=UPI003F6B82E3